MNIEIIRNTLYKVLLHMSSRGLTIGGWGCGYGGMVIYVRFWDRTQLYQTLISLLSCSCDG